MLVEVSTLQGNLDATLCVLGEVAIQRLEVACYVHHYQKTINTK
jgi:hypothetical protein